MNKPVSERGIGHGALKFIRMKKTVVSGNEAAIPDVLH